MPLEIGARERTRTQVECINRLGAQTTIPTSRSLRMRAEENVGFAKIVLAGGAESEKHRWLLFIELASYVWYFRRTRSGAITLEIPSNASHFLRRIPQNFICE